MTADLTTHPLPFGGSLGLALVPVSDAGRDWLWDLTWDGRVNYLDPVIDACMAGFPADAIGFEPQDWPEIVTAARDAGLVIEGVE